MDRLSAVVPALALCTLLPACSDGGGKDDKSASRSRFEAVEAAEPTAVDLSQFCEPLHEPTAAPSLSLPPLHPEGTTDPAAGKKRWINIWATWCKPCIEELPRLAKWRDELQSRVGYELVFLSADGDPTAVEGFAKEHPEVAGSMQLQSAEGLDPWLQELGLQGSAVLPVHVFVDERDKVRCLRTAGIGESDRAAVEQLLVSM